MPGMSTSRGVAREARSLPVRIAGTVAIAVIAGLAACDGTNLFGPVQVPNVVDLVAPASVDLGGQLPVTVHALGPIPIDSIVVSVAAGGFEQRIVVEGEEHETDMTREVAFDIPEIVNGSVLLVTAVAWDDRGNDSEPATRQVALTDGVAPAVSGSLSATAIGQGDTLRVTVEASDNVGLLLVGMRIRDLAGTVIYNDVRPAPGPTVERTFSWVAPGQQEPGTYSVQVYADDTSNNRTVTEAGSFEVEFRDTNPPEVRILTPFDGEIVSMGDSVFVRARVQDDVGFQSVQMEGLSFRGDADLGTDVTVTRFERWDITLNQPVSDTTLTRYLRPTGGDVAEIVHVIVTSTDLFGNVGADTVRIDLREEDDSGP